MAKRKKKNAVSKKKRAHSFPSKNQWGQFFKISTKKEKQLFSALVGIAIISFIVLSTAFYLQNTEATPARGGELKEGIIGQPRFLNPLYLSAFDADRDIVEVLFAGLMKYDSTGALVGDLIESYQIEDQGRSIDVVLKDNLMWHDKKPITADDIIFTINLIQEPQTQSPLRINWMGIAIEKISDKIVRFKLPQKYSGFLESLCVKILPEHIFQDIAPKDLPWELMSQQYLIGSGPFQFKKINQDKNGFISELILERNNNYHGKKPYLDQVTFSFYQNDANLLGAAKVGAINSFALNDLKEIRNINNDFKEHLTAIPRYFALFFKQNIENIFSEQKIKEAVALAIDKEKIVADVFNSQGEVVSSPILASFFDFALPSTVYQYNKTEAEEILEQDGFAINPETGFREKIFLPDADFSFDKNLTNGSQGRDVTELQKCLANDPDIYPNGTISGYFGNQTEAAVIKFQEKYAADILTPIGLTKGTGDVKPMTREKLNEICFRRNQELALLEFTLTTSNKFPLVEIAESIKEQLAEIGMKVNIKKVSLSDLQTSILTKREYEVLLFGEALGMIPDPFPFWHSSQKEYPGLNITEYQSKKVDNYLENAREAESETEQKQSLEGFQETLLSDLPAIFLVRPDYVYLMSSRIKGYNMEKITEPSKRFSTIEDWYIKTTRKWN